MRLVKSVVVRLLMSVFPRIGDSYKHGRQHMASVPMLMVNVLAYGHPRADAVIKALRHRRNTIFTSPARQAMASVYFSFEALAMRRPGHPELFCIIDQDIAALDHLKSRALTLANALVLHFRLAREANPADTVPHGIQSFDLRDSFTPEQQDAFISSRIEEMIEVLLRRPDPALAAVADISGGESLVRPVLVPSGEIPPASAVAFAIPTLNGGAEFESALRSIRGQRIYGQCPIFIVDSGSTDSTIELARKYGAQIHHCDKKDFNHGRTRDFIIDQTGAPFVVLLVQDAALMDSETIPNMMRHMANSRVAGVYTVPLPVEGHDEFASREVLGHCAYLGPRAKVFSVGSRQVYESMDFALRLRLMRFDNVCSVLRRDAWMMHPFGQIAFAEDIHWSRAAQLAGHSIVFEPLGRVFHSHMRSPDYTRKRYTVELFHVSQMLGSFPVDFKDVNPQQIESLVSKIAADSASFLDRVRMSERNGHVSIANLGILLREANLCMRISPFCSGRNWRAERSLFFNQMAAMIQDLAAADLISADRLYSLIAKAEAAAIGGVWGQYLSYFRHANGGLSPDLERRLLESSGGV